MASLKKWVHEEICKLVGPEIPQSYTDYILEIQNRGELIEYLRQLGGEEIASPRVESFADELAAKRGVVQDNFTVYKKGISDDIEPKPSVRPKKKKEQKKVINLNDIEDSDTAKTPLDSAAKTVSQKKKVNYVSLYGEGGEMRTNAVLLPGRHPCECQAQKHRLVNNCLSCGRVVCEQEGSGPCLFCSELVCTPEQKKILARESNKSDKLLKTLSAIGGGGTLSPANEAESKGLKTAQEYKNRLLEYDRTYMQRTKVIDDESDYYATDNNVWLSQKEREAEKKKEREMRELKFGSRLNRKVTLDFAGRRVIDEEVFGEDYKPEEALPPPPEKPSTAPSMQETFPELPMPKLMSKENKNPGKNIPKSKASDKKHIIKRLQDKELQKMSDTGMCLSMHQPWASLLVKGIKRHEGRTWYSNHRGRLWVAAASHKPSPDEIKAVEDQHRQYVDRDVEFPSEYPTSCLLGCVNVEDVLGQEDYREKFPAGESASPYVFVCSDFEELFIKIPISGKHKIWKLPSNVHQAAKKGKTILHGGF